MDSIWRDIESNIYIYIYRNIYIYTKDEPTNDPSAPHQGVTTRSGLDSAAHRNHPHSSHLGMIAVAGALA